MPKISIIVPAYNAENYIKECIESILNQTLKDIEVIIIDDGSTDNTGVIIDNLCKDDKRVLVIHQNNHGLYATRKIGLSKATGEYIGWVDADDFVDLNMYEMLYENAKLNNSDVCYCDYKWYPKRTKNKEKWFREYLGIKDVDYVERNSQPWNKIVKRELLERLKISDKFEKCFDEIYIEVLLEAQNPISISNQLYNYRVAVGTMSGSYNNVEHYKSFVTSSIELEKDLSQYYNSEYWSQYFKYRISYYRLITMLIAAYNNQKEEYSIQKKELLAQEQFYINNRHFWHIMIKNNGILKGVILGMFVPINYYFTKAISKFAF